MLTGDRVGAFFDVDHTVLEINSGRQWLSYLWRNGQISVRDAARSMLWLLQYRLSLLDFEAMTRKAIVRYAGTDVEALQAEVDAWFRAEVEEWICRQARDAIEEHRAKGHVLVLLTSGMRYATRPLSRVLAVEHVVCTRFEERDGRLTGRMVPPPCYGPGKLVHAERFAQRHGINLDRSYFYSDSYTDMPVLRRVGHPVVVNPDPRLRKAAVALGWGFERWTA